MKQINIFLIITAFLFNYSCSTAQQMNYTSKNKKAIKYFEKGLASYRNAEYDRNELSNAEAYLKEALDKDPNFVDAHILLSQIYINKGDLKSAIVAKEKGLAIMPEYSKNEYFYLAKMQLADAQYAKCAKNAEKFLTYSNTNEHFHYLAKKYIKNAEFAQDAMQNPVDFNPVNLGKNINTDRQEYFPTITGDNNTILYTRLVKDDKAVLRGGKQEDFYISVKDADGEWRLSEKVSNRINTFLNEGAPTLSADGNYLIFTSCEGTDGYGETRTGKGSCDLFYTKKIGSQWARPRNLGAPINTAHWESQPCFSADGRTLYFIRGIRKSRARRNPEDQDIYVTHLLDNGTWTNPKKLSSVINTPEKEESVFIHPDGQTLYFGSNGHPGMGGVDLYMSRKDADGNWTTPVNLGYPINTSSNENSIIVSPDGKLAYFASDREGGFGGLDLYSFDLPEKVKPIATTYMKGKVYDAESKMTLGATFELIDVETGELIIKSKANDMTGDFLVSIPTNKELALNVSEKGYFFFSKNYSFKGNSSKKDPFLVDVPLEKIKVSKKGFVLENVFFDVNKYELKPQSKVELNKLYQFLLANRTLKVELGGHTDSDGDDKKNQILSENRAKAVVEYLINAGIDKNRLTYKGYGETEPVAPNDTPENKAKNRRTELKIIGE